MLCCFRAHAFRLYTLLNGIAALAMLIWAERLPVLGSFFLPESHIRDVFMEINENSGEKVQL